MNKPEFESILEATGATLVVRNALPAGPGVFDDEVGGEGPWYGIQFEHGTVYGWVKDEAALYDAEIFVRHLGPHVVIRRMAHLLASSAEEIQRKGRIAGLLEAAHIVRHLRPNSACTCGGYVSFDKGIPRHVSGCLVGECIDAADEIEGRAEEIAKAMQVVPQETEEL